MKVKELIEKLSTFPPNLPVYLDGYEGGVGDPGDIREVRVALDWNGRSGWYYGPHEVVEVVGYPSEATARGKGCAIVRAVLIPR